MDRSDVRSHAILGPMLVVALILCAGCHLRVASPVPGGFTIDRSLVLNGHPIRLHMHATATAAPGGHPLLVYATGDGGWSGKDLSTYQELVASGWPIVGFDAHDYVNHLGKGDASTTTPDRLAGDYRAIIAAAADALRLPDKFRVILVGISRGAGLSVVAAGEPSFRPELSGVLAIGLTREEEYARWISLVRRAGARQVPEMVQVYEYLPRLGSLPVAVVQSTRDHYLPAETARTLFGPDTPSRRFIAIDARNHSFRGARSEMYEAMRSSLAWIGGQAGSVGS